MRALDIAKYIVAKCTIENEPIGNLQLQKILYYIQVAFLQQRGKECFSDDIEAWKFGPVVRSVYIEYCTYAAMPIIEFNEPSLPFDASEMALIDSIIEKKRKSKPWKLVSDTHMPGKAWDRVYQNGKGDKCIINKGLLKQYG